MKQSYFSPASLLLLLLLATLLFPRQLRAQGVGVGTTAPDASAALDIVATDKGALLPRLSETARTTMPAPAPGLIVYQQGGAKPGFWYNAGGTGVLPSPAVKWVRLTDSEGVSYDPATGLQVGPGPVTTSSGPFTVGTAAVSANGPFSGAQEHKSETIYTAAELTAAGLQAGPLLSLTYVVGTKNTTTPFTNFTVQLGHTAAAATSTTFSTGLTLVYSGTISTTLGDNQFVFNQAPFSWDGSSSVVVQTCFSNPAPGPVDDFANFAASPVNQLLYTYSCAAVTGSQFAYRSVVRFTQAPSNGYTLPAVAGGTGQVLTMQANGQAIWDDPAWFRNGPHAYRPFGPGMVGLGTTSTRTRLSITPSTVEPKITLWDGGGTASHYGFGISGGQLNYHVGSTGDNHVFYAGGKNGPETGVSTELMRLRGSGFLTLGGTGPGTSRLDIVNDGGGAGGADDILLRSFGAAGGPGLSLQRARGTQAAPLNLQKDDFLGDIGFGGQANGFAAPGFNLSGLMGFYRGNGLTYATDLWFKTSGNASMALDSVGRLGVGTLAPAYRLDVNGSIRAITGQGIILDAQDRPLITRGFDPFTSGNYTGLGRWGLFMELNTLTFGVPVMANRGFQWARYNLDSSIGSKLMTLSQEGYLGLGRDVPGSRLDIVNDTGTDGAADDVNISSYGGAASPSIGLVLTSARGTLAAPVNLEHNDALGTLAFTGRTQAGSNLWLSGLGANYLYNGTSQKLRSNLNFYTSGVFRATIDSIGRMGVGTVTPQARLSLTPTATEPKITLWDGNSAVNHYGFGISGFQLNYHVAATSDNHVFYAGGKNGPEAGVSTELLRVQGNGYLGLNNPAPATRLDIVSDNQGGGGADDVLLRSYGAAASPGVGMRRYRGTRAAPANAQNGDFLGEFGLSTYYNGANGNFNQSGIQGHYRGDGTTNLTDLDLVTSSQVRARIDETGQMGIGTTAPAHRLHVITPEAAEHGLYVENTYAGTTDTRGIYGRAVNNPGFGLGGEFEGGYQGVRAIASATSYNGSSYGVSASASGTAGTHYALYGSASGGTSAYGLWATATGAGTNYAGYFQGNVHVNGTLSKSAGTFRIDHPQDPENKYLVHSFVESPDMLNVYNGNVVTDAQGQAVVQLPAYFEAENKDFKYQLTVIGQFAQAIVGEKVRDNQFVVRTDKPGVEVSWQVTGVRNAPYARQHPIVPEVEKKGEERGKYLNPELYGRPAAEGIGAVPAEAAGKLGRRQ